MSNTMLSWSRLLGALALTGCCMGGTAAPAAAPAPAPVALAPGVPYSVADGVPVWSDSYAARFLFDGTTSSYWCTASGPTFPIVATLTPTGGPITGIDFDTRVSGYETSAIGVVTVEALGPTGAPLDAQTVALVQNDVTSFSFPTPLSPTRLRVTFHSNFGGSYAALAELTLRNGPGTGRPATPTAAPALARPGIPYTVAPGLPTWNDTYSAARMQDLQPSTYWCTQMGQTFPFTGTLMLTAPALVSAVRFDNRLPGYDTSGVQSVVVNVYGPDGSLATTTSALLPQSSSTSVPLPIPVVAGRVELVFGSNFGGSYVGLAELALE